MTLTRTVRCNTLWRRNADVQVVNPSRQAVETLEDPRELLVTARFNL